MTLLRCLVCILSASCAMGTPQHASAESAPAKAEPISVDTDTLPWTAATPAPGFAEGRTRRLLQRNPENGAASSLVRHPKGFVEPRHLHTTANHGVYLLKGRVKIGDLVAGPGHFFYAPAGQPHGPIEALEDIEFLIWTDGPLDLQLLNEAPAAKPD